MLQTEDGSDTKTTNQQREILEEENQEENKGATLQGKMSQKIEDNEEEIRLTVEEEEDIIMEMDQVSNKEVQKDGENEDKQDSKENEGNDARSCTSEIETVDIGDPLQYLWVSNLNLEMKSKDIKSIFSKYGTVLKVKMMLDYNNLDVKVCGLVKMSSKKEAEEALIKMPIRFPPPYGMHVKSVTDTELIVKIESLKADKKSAKAKGNPHDEDERNEGDEEHKVNGEDKDSKSPAKRATRSVLPSRSHSSMRHQIGYSTHRGDRGPGGYGARPYPPNRRPFYRDPYHSPRRGFLYDWRDEERHFYYEKLWREKEQRDIMEKRWILRQEQNKVMKAKMEIENMKKEMSRMMKEGDESKRHVRTTGGKRSYQKDDEWDSRKKPSSSTYYAEESGSGHSRYNYDREKYSSRKYLQAGSSTKGSNWEKWPSTSISNQAALSPAYSPPSSPNVVAPADYGNNTYERDSMRHY